MLRRVISIVLLLFSMLSIYVHAVGNADTMMHVSLLYGESQSGEYYYTNSDMPGFIRLEPSNAVVDLEDFEVVLSFPKEYVERDSINIPSFTTSSPITSYTIGGVAEIDDTYSIGIHFEKYDKTQTMMVPFVLSFLDNVTPQNYELPVAASVIKNGNVVSESNILTYKPLYNPWGIEKFVNSNRNPKFSEDGSEVVVTPFEDGGDPYLDDTSTVDFFFKVNNINSQNSSESNLKDFRDAHTVTLTDPLPLYVDTDGNTRIAVFNDWENDGWTLSPDGTSVSKTYSDSCCLGVLRKIYDDKPLRLRFPGLKLDEMDDGVLGKYLNNDVELVAEPTGAAEGEGLIEIRDSLLFLITDDPSTKGHFEKVTPKGNIYDLEMYKTNPYPWKLVLKNEDAQPLQWITIQDRHLVENGETLVDGLDEALKFVSLESNVSDSVFAPGLKFDTVVQSVVAYYTDGTSETYGIALDGDGNFRVDFNDSKICYGYDIIFMDDYAMYYNERASFTAYTVYRDPDGEVVPDGVQMVTYRNAARSVNIYEKNGATVTSSLYAERSYNMLPVSEDLYIEKQTWFNNGSQNNTVGSKYQYFFFVRGSLVTPDMKIYGDIRIVDLLPEGIRYVRTTNGYNEYMNEAGVMGQPDIIENYHNSGRTALIYHTTYDILTQYWSTTPSATLSFEVEILDNVKAGSIRNEVYIVGDNLEEYRRTTGGALDIYDLDNDGETDDMIAYSYSDAVIVAARSMYAEKFIAPAGSDRWNKQGLALVAGADFDYLLSVNNETQDDHDGLVVYDLLPAVGDVSIFNGSARGSEFSVRLREPIVPPDGYTVWYTDSDYVYTGVPSDVIAADIWSEFLDGGLSTATAFKIVANEGTVLSHNETFSVRVPVRTADSFDDITADRLMAYNSFGFKTRQAPMPKESNTVYVSVPFASCVFKKVNSISGIGIGGAEFELRRDGHVWRVTSDAKGLFRFDGLTQGEYVLEEVGYPEGYREDGSPMTLTVSQNPLTGESSVALGGIFEGEGIDEIPFLVKNTPATTVMLPDTGGSGWCLGFALGILCLLGGSLLLRRKDL